jgi:hypothetical protein
MATKIDMQGKTFGRLTVESPAESTKKGDAVWNVVCACGTHKTAVGEKLRNGESKSCGCLRKELSRVRLIAQTTTHGMYGTKTYMAHDGMKSRCTNPKNRMFKHYGGKGVTVCSRWMQSFENFFADMGEAPEGTSLGRILDRGDYEPSNVFWQTKEEQSLARRNNNALTEWETKNNGRQYDTGEKQ